MSRFKSKAKNGFLTCKVIGTYMHIYYVYISRSRVIHFVSLIDFSLDYDVLNELFISTYHSVDSKFAQVYKNHFTICKRIGIKSCTIYI